MKIYFAFAMTGGRPHEDTYRLFAQALLDDGQEVLTAANAGLKSDQGPETDIDPKALYTRDTQWIEQCDVLIAEVSTPSHGVGYEISYALERGKPVLCVWRKGIRVSKMITGNTAPGFSTAEYADIAKGIEMVRKYMRQKP